MAENRDLETLRSEMAMKLGIRLEPGRAPEAQAFRRAVASEILRRRGLTRPEIGSVLFLSRRGLDFNLSVVSSRARTAPAFREFLDNVSSDPAEHWLAAALGRFGCQG
jgi:hypothetical protein